MAVMKQRNIIPPGWEEHHRPVVEGAMTAICEIRGPDGDYDYETGAQTPGPVLKGGIPCRVRSRLTDRGGYATGQLVDTVSYHISAPLSMVPEFDVTDDGPILVVTGYVDGYAGDPQLVGRHLRITHVHPASIVWERNFEAVMEV